MKEVIYGKAVFKVADNGFGLGEVGELTHKSPIELLMFNKSTNAK